MIKRQKLILRTVLAILIMLSFGACGGSEEDYYYSVTVVNHTDAAITVRYDWDETFWWVDEWAQEDTIAVNGSKFISWFSENWPDAYIEVDYQGKTIGYSVGQAATLDVYVGDFL